MLKNMNIDVTYKPLTTECDNISNVILVVYGGSRS